ncbi:MAG TPA: hypothetical protein VEA80_16685 [Vitreimonas sp.]|uniref:hypothetical protein n=1 Tax=Vitreimonas sp. TaxID=3069702 RepID=UPI002D34028C|nr:hypothetical protein [Vitreimonas sp.]HYD89116.1 hypothetical protein [Vitreimonas sp.]
MAANVKSHRSPRRKRGRWWAYFARRFFALAITVAALAAASWFAPMLRPPAEPPLLPELVETRAAETGLEPLLLEVDIALDLAGPPAPPRRARARAVPLDAAAQPQDPGYEILSAAELARISQARD